VPLLIHQKTEGGEFLRWGGSASEGHRCQGKKNDFRGVGHAREGLRGLEKQITEKEGKKVQFHPGAGGWDWTGWLSRKHRTRKGVSSMRRVPTVKEKIAKKTKTSVTVRGGDGDTEKILCKRRGGKEKDAKRGGKSDFVKKAPKTSFRVRKTSKSEGGQRRKKGCEEDIKLERRIKTALSEKKREKVARRKKKLERNHIRCNTVGSKREGKEKEFLQKTGAKPRDGQKEEEPKSRKKSGGHGTTKKRQRKKTHSCRKKVRNGR